MERYKKYIAAGEDYFEGDYSFMCVLSIKVPITKKKSGNLFNDPRIFRQARAYFSSQSNGFNYLHLIQIILFTFNHLFAHN